MPVPPAGPLVEKNGSKMRSRVAGSMPCPVSMTDTTTSDAVDGAGLGADPELAAARHGGGRVQAQVEQDLAEL
jgi:hypothetical protein